jgi:hypothetical protein
VALLPYEASSPSSNMQDGAEGEQLMAGAVPLSASGHMGASATTTNNSSSSSGGAMCSAPLVMSPLVVLPAAAAQELQQLWEVGCAAMQERGAAGEFLWGGRGGGDVTRVEMDGTVNGVHLAGHRRSRSHGST